MYQQILQYFSNNSGDYVKAFVEHMTLSAQALIFAILIGLPLGYVSASKPKLKQIASVFTQGLRVIPSLGILFILIPIIGVGRLPAIIALVILAVPPILLNTIVGLNEVPKSLIETALGLGMAPRQVLRRVTLPLALPHILNGIKLALIEIIASATLATYIGAGGLGAIIFTGLGLYRYDLLLIGGGSVALISFISMIFFDVVISRLSINEHKKKERIKMKRKKLYLGSLLVIIICAIIGFVFVEKHAQGDNSSKADKTIRIGSKDFTENLVIGEIYALALEDNGYKVDRVSNISSSLIHNSLVNKKIDLYPEYTGTGLLSILKDKMETNPQKVYDKVKKGYETKFHVTWLNYASANDSQGLVIRADIAKELGIKTISDLQKHASELNFASQGEFDQRDDALPGLIKTYGPFDWKSSKIYDNSLKYTVLDNKEADVTPAYTSEGQLVNTDKYLLLKDDKQFWPPYNLAPVVRNEVLKANPGIETILNKVSAKLDTATVTKLNAQVDVDGQDYQEVAKAFYKTIK